MDDTKQSPTAKDKDQQDVKIETKQFKSKDGKWWVHQSIFTEFKPVSYVQKVLDSENKETE